MQSAFLFDLDGVLVDSEGLYTEFWSGIDRLYPTGIEDFAHYIKGNTLTRILQMFATDAIRADIEQRIHRYEEQMVYPLFPGAVELLEELQRRSIPAAIVTSSDDAKMEQLRLQLPQLWDLVDAVITGSMVTRSKPDPQGYLMGAEALGCPPQCCVVVEDSVQGLRAGRAAGARVVGLTTTNSRSVVEPLADITFDTIAEIVVDHCL